MKSCPAPVANPVRVAVPPDHFLAPWFIIEYDKAILSVVPEFLVHSLHGLLDEGYKHSESRWMAFGVRPNRRHDPPFLDRSLPLPPGKNPPQMQSIFKLYGTGLTVQSSR